METIESLGFRGKRIMLENLPIMLCCTAPKMYLLCSTNAPIMLDKLSTKQLSCLSYPKTHSLSACLSDRVDRVGFVPVSRSSFTLTYSSIEARSWLSSDVGKELVACKLLPAT